MSTSLQNRITRIAAGLPVGDPVRKRLLAALTRNASSEERAIQKLPEYRAFVDALKRGSGTDDWVEDTAREYLQVRPDRLWDGDDLLLPGIREMGFLDPAELGEAIVESNAFRGKEYRAYQALREAARPIMTADGGKFYDEDLWEMTLYPVIAWMEGHYDEYWAHSVFRDEAQDW